MARFDPTRPDMSPYGFTCVRWNPTTMARSDRHNEIELNLLSEGRLVYLLGGRRVEVLPGRLTAFWACAPHQVLSFEGLREYFVMTIPLAWFLQWRLPEPMAQAMLQGRVAVEQDEGLARGDLDRFALWTEDLASRSGERERSCALEVEARLRRFSLGLLESPGSSRHHTGTVPDEDLTCAERMATYIALHYAEALSVERISTEVGLHPNYAMTLFRRTFGATLGAYITQHRLSHAQRLLVTTQDSVERIGLASGFGSTSRFHECFRKAFGCSPREYRAHVRQEG